MSMGKHLHVHCGWLSESNSIVQATQQKKAARLLVVEKLHWDLSAKYDASRAEAARLQVPPCVADACNYSVQQLICCAHVCMLTRKAAVQVELAAQKAVEAAAVAVHKQQMDALQREQIAVLMQLASMIRVGGVASRGNNVTTATEPSEAIGGQQTASQNLAAARTA